MAVQGARWALPRGTTLARPALHHAAGLALRESAWRLLHEQLRAPVEARPQADLWRRGSFSSSALRAVAVAVVVVVAIVLSTASSLLVLHFPYGTTPIYSPLDWHSLHRNIHSLGPALPFAWGAPSSKRANEQTTVGRKVSLSL